MRDVASVPAAANVSGLRSGHGVSASITLLNVVAVALWTVGVFAALYAGALEGRVSESRFRRAVVWLVGSRLAGTLLAQLLLVPSALLIACVARII